MGWLPSRGVGIAGLLVAIACGGSTDSPTVDASADAAVDARTDAGVDASPPGDSSLPTDGATGDASLVPSGCIDVIAVGDHVYTCNGLKYDVHLPAACAKGGCGIVLDVHGATMSARMEDANSNMRFIGERDGYVVVQPNASGNPPNAIWNPSVDYDKVWAFFDLATQVYAVDAKRVHMMGFSQGGRMTWTFACKYAARIASAAPAAEAGCTAQELSAATRQVPLFYMHGTQDALISFSGAAIPQRDAVVTAWAMGAPQPVSSDASHIWTRYTNGKGTVFEFVQHDYTTPAIVLKGHCYPGSKDPGNAPGQLFTFACTGPNAFVWGEEAIKFFKAHPLP